MDTSLVVCHRCPLRQRICAGTCACLVDGRDIIEHAAAADCPKGYHDGVPLPEPREQWPLAAKLLAKAARPGDVGLGDVVQRLAAGIGGETYKVWYTRLTGRPCPCGQRQDALNQLFPL